MQDKSSAIASNEEFMQALALLLNFIESEDQTDEPNDLLAELVARRRLQEYLADPSISVPYEEFHRRMVDEGVLDE
jgi:hypothetical protein